MLIESDNMISITKFQKEMTKRIRELQNTKKELYIMKKNVVSAVLLDPDEYYHLKKLEEELEQSSIANVVSERMANYDRAKNKSWEEIKHDYES